MKCTTPTLHVTRGEDGDFDLVRKDSKDTPIDCSGWTIETSIHYEGTNLGIDPTVAFTDASKGEALLTITLEEAGQITPDKGCELHILWTTDTGKRKLSKLLMEVC